MKLSILDMVPLLEGAEPSTALQQSVQLAQTAEKLGYTRYWVSEHHDMDMLASACPEVWLAHLGLQTKTIRIGSGAVLLPHYKPLKVAEAFHLLATLYPGRIDLGVGRAPGGSAHVTMALSGNFLEQVRHMPDSLRSLTELLGNRFRVEEEPVTARPVPTVPPELWLLGTNEKSAGYAAQYGTGYVFGQFMSDRDGADILSGYREAFRPEGSLREPKTIVAIGAVCAETEEEARALAAEGRALFHKGDFAEGEEAFAGPAKLLVGTAGQIKARLQEMEQRYQVDEFMIVTVTPRYKERIRSYELLAEAVFG